MIVSMSATVIAKIFAIISVIAVKMNTQLNASAFALRMSVVAIVMWNAAGFVTVISTANAANVIVWMQ